MVVIGRTPGDKPQKAKEKVGQYLKAGATWWLESLYMERDSLEAMRKRIRQGPPKVE